MNTIIDTASERISGAEASRLAPLRALALVKRYDDRRILDNVSLTLEAGAVLGLIGRNGAGKTTLIRCLLGLLQPDAGEALIEGRPALQLDDATKARVGYVPQQPVSLGWMTVRQSLDFVASFYPRWDGAFVDDTLARWQLPMKLQLAKLSPGERQRVAIIRALAPRPEVLVLDEPAAALDPVARRELLGEIAGRAGEAGATVLLSTHIVSDVERVASHVAFLHEGRLLLHATLDDIKERHVRLQLPAADVPVGPLPGEMRRTVSGSSASILLVRDDDAQWPDLVHAPGVHCSHLSLEDFFVEVAG